jgi:hypothetical protein
MTGAFVVILSIAVTFCIIGVLWTIKDYMDEEEPKVVLRPKLKVSTTKSEYVWYHPEKDEFCFETIVATVCSETGRYNCTYTIHREVDSGVFSENTYKLLSTRGWHYIGML